MRRALSSLCTTSLRLAAVRGASLLRRSLPVASLGLGAAVQAGAQQPAARTTPPGWTFVVTPYAWMAGLDGQVGIRSVETSVDLGFGDILRHLRFGAMGTVEAHSGPLVLGLDGIYVSMRDSKAFAVRVVAGEVILDQRETILQPTVGYSYDGGVWGLDALVGARYWNLSTDLGINPARLQDRMRSGGVDWLDATGGLRVRFRAMSNLHFSVAGDAGGGGSRNTWQALGNASLDLSKRYNIMAGYRYLAVDYDRDNFLFDTHMNGFLLAANFHF